MSDPESPPPGDLTELLAAEGIDPATLRACLSAVHPVDLAELLDDVDLDNRVRIFEVLEPDRAAQTLAAMPHDYKVELVDRMGEQRLADVIDRMPDYAVADIIDHLPAHKERSVMSKLEAEKRDDVRQLREYPANTAGGRMTRNFVTVPETFTAGETIKAIQGAVDSHTVDFIYVVDEDGRLHGVISLPKLMIHSPETPVSAFMRREVSFVGPTVDQEEVAKLAQKYRLRAVPVVDVDMKVLGVVTLQDIIDVIKSEASEDIMKLAGADHVDPLRASFATRLRARVPWLAAAMVLELGLAWIMWAYGGTLDARALAYFIPIIMAMGGNVGLQSSTTVVRGLATGDIAAGKMIRVIASESRVGVALGLLAGLITGAMAWVMNFGDVQALLMAGIIAASMALSMSVAATMGAITPLLIHRLKYDPAVASGPFITAINDVVNVTLYLSVAALLLAKVVPR
jgi:magnesium transporter